MFSFIVTNKNCKHATSTNMHLWMWYVIKRIGFEILPVFFSDGCLIVCLTVWVEEKNLWSHKSVWLTQVFIHFTHVKETRLCGVTFWQIGVSCLLFYGVCLSCRFDHLQQYFSCGGYFCLSCFWVFVIVQLYFENRIDMQLWKNTFFDIHAFIFTTNFNIQDRLFY